MIYFFYTHLSIIVKIINNDNTDDNLAEDDSCDNDNGNEELY